MGEQEQKTMPKRRKFLDIFIILLIIVFGTYFYARYLEPSKLIVKEYKISSTSIPSNFSGTKIIHFSDLFYGNTTDLKNVDNIIKKINLLRPDIVVYTGNLASKKMTEKETTDIINKLAKIEATLGKYSVKGNIDYDSNYDSIMSESGFKILENQYELVYNDGLIPVYLCGISSMLKTTPNLDEALGYFKNLGENIYNPSYKIVLTHEGDYIDKVLEYDSSVNLILAGNSLNGSIYVPYYGQVFLPEGSKKYYAPYYKKDNTNIYVSSGIGTNDHPYRLFNKPSINLYRLKSL